MIRTFILLVMRLGLLELVIQGNLRLTLNDEVSALTISYGLGFGEVASGTLEAVTIHEVAVIKYLRYLVPFGEKFCEPTCIVY
jgi:hypothetical protein